MSEILTVPQISKEYGIGRKKVIKLMQNKNCKTLPRHDGEEYLITRKNWEDFINQ